MLSVLKHPLADHIITHLRDETTKPATFRTLTYQLTLMLAIEATRDLATEEKAVKTLRPLYEEHAKMFAPLGFLPGATPAQIEAISHRGGWYEAGAPTLERYMDTGAWYAGPPEGLVAYLKELEARYPGMEHINLSMPLTTPRAMMVDQFQWISEAVMPAFGVGPHAG